MIHFWISKCSLYLWWQSMQKSDWIKIAAQWVLCSAILLRTHLWAFPSFLFDNLLYSSRSWPQFDCKHPLQSLVFMLAASNQTDNKLVEKQRVMKISNGCLHACTAFSRFLFIFRWQIFTNEIIFIFHIS